MIIIAILAIIFGLLTLWIANGITNPEVKKEFFNLHPNYSDSFVDIMAIITGLIGFILFMCGIYILIW